MSAPEDAATFEIVTCGTCHLTFVPADGVCPRCASRDLTSVRVPAMATVLAATSVEYPAAGWASPHPLALVEIAESVRLLAVPVGALPPVGAVVRLERAGAYYRAHAVG